MRSVIGTGISRHSYNEVVLARLENFGDLGAISWALVRSLGGLELHSAGSEFHGEGVTAQRPRFLVSGWAARVRWLSDGRRQILSFLMPGDAIGLDRRATPMNSAMTIALTDVRSLDATPLSRALHSPDQCWSDLREAMATAAAVNEAYLLDQIVRLGRQTAYERLCHTLLELRHRLETVGLATENSLALPLTQEMLADATGLSIVHVNRVLQQLRREKMLELRGGRLNLLNRQQMEKVADFRTPQPRAWRGSGAVVRGGSDAAA
ncbi:MAG: Crp/Fnr family transcriptional regulator [Deltaproteobacteria bacterium]|nr:Crp/Fnr family transcriptional regulator [Deltaproteobacteria bacterium]